MIGQAIYIVVWLVLAVMSLFAVQYCSDRDWAFVFIAGLFVVSALVTLVILGDQVFS